MGSYQATGGKVK